MDETQARFNGYAVVEIMGHQQTAGWVTTEYFGGVAMLHVLMPGEEGQEQAVDRDLWTGRETIGPGSTYKINRHAVDEWIGAQSIYRLRPCTEGIARDRQPSSIEVISRAARPVLAAVREGGDDFELEEESESEEE